MNSELKSGESVLLDPTDNTLEEIQDVPYNIILREPLRKKKRGKAILNELHSSFDNFEEINKKVEDGEVNEISMIFKKQEDTKYRYYCRYLSHGCQAALYLQLQDGKSGHCFVSEQDHSNHPDKASQKDKVDQETKKRIVKLENLGLKPDGIIRQLFKEGIEPPKKTTIDNIQREIRKIKKVTKAHT
ncbi:hypothetical protein BpHYR1_040491 [Brachionus plicatilis]|uniref:Uncharacterized protein n=1 Tax=Brachionus plicatilis TaxID=10195 RepID=A0A3M7RJ42_BRAPC|nr:hypothetical protein BpHYR1_040491 [Brachionus plicatilis]